MKAVDLQPSAYPGREKTIKQMFYKGNLLMLGLGSRIDKQAIKESKQIKPPIIIADISIRKKISFKRE